MNIEEIRNLCLSFPEATESFPFDEETLVFKVAGKMFALLALEKNATINLKCDPEKAVELRTHYEAVKPGYHMNKKHWNTVEFDKISPQLVKEMIVHSYKLVVSKLPANKRRTLEAR